MGIIFYFNNQNKKYQDTLNRAVAEQKDNLKATYDKKLAESKESAQTLFYQALGSAKKNLSDYAAVTLEAAAKKDPKWRDLAYYTGYFHLKMLDANPYRQGSAEYVNWQKDNLDKSKTYLEKARDLDPLYAPTYEALAVVYQKLGDAQNAEICYNKAKEFKR